MKKSIAILALLAIVATGAFAQGFPLSMSAGGGLLFDLSVGNGAKMKFDVMGMSGDMEASLQNLSFGAFGFFDATYAEVDVNFAYGMLTYKSESSGFLGGGSGPSGDANAMQLGFTLLGKYPFDLGGFTLFPLLGLDYNVVLSVWDKDSSTDKPGDSSQLGFLAGVGLDFPFSDALFLRAEAMFHLRLPSKWASDLKSGMGSVGSYGSVDTTLGMGPRIKVGLGYKFGGGSGSSSSGSSSSSRSGRYMLVNADSLNVRSGPSADTALVGSLPRNTRVEVLDRSGTWWRIRSGNITGYVNSSYLKAE